MAAWIKRVERWRESGLSAAEFASKCADGSSNGSEVESPHGAMTINPEGLSNTAPFPLSGAAKESAVASPGL